MAVVGFGPSCLEWRLYGSLEPSCAESKEGLVQAVFTSCNEEIQSGEGSFVMIGDEGVRAAVPIATCVKRAARLISTASLGCAAGIGSQETSSSFLTRLRIICPLDGSWCSSRC